MDEQRQWHRLFGMSWADFFVGQPVTVEVEKDLSQQQQFLDVVLVRRDMATPLTGPMPDGFDDLAGHNLISYKSHRETLDGWMLNELIAHYVNYRKLISPRTDTLLQENEFRLFAVSARFPRVLNQRRPLNPIGDGVYEIEHFTGTMRLIVVAQLPQQAHNALLHLFSASEELVRFGSQQYRPRSPRTSTFLFQLYDRYREEGMPMPFTVEEFVQETLLHIAQDPEHARQILKYIPVEQRLEGVPVEQRLEGVPVEQRLEGVPVEQRLEGVPVEQRLEGVPVEQRLEGVPVEQRLEGVPVEQRLLGLTREERAELLRRLQAEAEEKPAEN